MTLDQLIAEVAAAPTQVEAFNVLMNCLSIEMRDASAGNSPPPSVQEKYDEVFSGATSKANEILNAIEFGKPPLDPVKVKEVPAFDPNGPMSPPAPQQRVFIERPAEESLTPVDDAKPSPFSAAHEPVPNEPEPAA